MTAAAPDPRFAGDAIRLSRAIAALQAAKHAADAGTLFASEDGLVAIEAVSRLFQTEDLTALYHDVWALAGCPTSDDIDAKLRRLNARSQVIGG